MPLNRAEQLVFDICRRSFLSLWSYANPLGASGGRELCDAMVICDPDLLIFSVKEVNVSRSADEVTRYQRWHPKAVEASARQLYGAERWINTSGVANVTRSDGAPGLPYPPAQHRRTHRIAVALGGDQGFQLRSGDLGRGFVHVFNERACETILYELDTIEDFVAYLRAKEAFFSGYDVLCPSEENLLAVYLNRRRAFPTANQPIYIKQDAWEALMMRPEYRAKKREDRPSYLWDSLVELVGKDVRDAKLEFGPTLTESEKALRAMARENRFARRLLGKALSDFLGYAAEKRTDSRMMQSRSGIGYVFVVFDQEVADDQEYRRSVVGLRCIVARTDMRDCATIIGIGMDRPSAAEGFSLTIVYMFQPNWSGEDVKRGEEIRAEYGYFRNPLRTRIREDEYPTA